MAITLGRDCTLAVNGGSASARSVTASESTEEIQVRPFGSREVCTYTTGYSLEVSVESIDDGFYDSAIGWCEAGTEVTVSGTGYSFTGVVTSVSDSQPLDSVRSFTVVFKRTYAGLRAATP